MWTNDKEIAGDGIDNDGNGYIDDVRGWNFASNAADPFDDNMHGTHCAGIIAGNSVTAMGIAPNIKIMPLKFLTAEGSGSLEGAIKAINYGVAMGADILSNSWGGGSYSQALFDKIKAAEEKGVLFVAASGNEYNNNDIRASYPNSYKLSNIISVGASTVTGGKASFSNYGSKTVHIFAPGKDIWSSVPGGYQSLSGTSMACPMVSGIAALVKSMHPEYKATELKQAIMDSAVKLQGLKGYSITNGLVNAYNAVK
jgi:subtilisin family serine protease